MTHDPLCPAPKDWWRSCICKELGMAESRGYQTGLLVGKTTVRRSVNTEHMS